MDPNLIESFSTDIYWSPDIEINWDRYGLDIFQRYKKSDKPCTVNNSAPRVHVQLLKFQNLLIARFLSVPVPTGRGPKVRYKPVPRAGSRGSGCISTNRNRQGRLNLFVYNPFLMLLFQFSLEEPHNLYLVVVIW